MNLKIFTVLISLFLLFAGNNFAQTNAPVLKDNSNGDAEEGYQIGEIRGSVRRKAVLLPKPLYPREALEAGADGAVKVEIVIDTEGTVISAKAVSGHPLLYPTAEETASKTKFRRTDSPDPNFREAGTLTYNFAIEKAGWLRIGFDLAAIQKAPTLRPFIVPRVARAFQPDWTEEHALLGKLTEMRRAEVENPNNMPNSDNPVFVRKNIPPQNGTLQSEIRGEIRISIPNPPTGERIALAQNLIALLQSRLASDPSSLWKFNTGTNLIKAFEIGRNPNESRNAAQILRQSLDTAPPEIPAETRGALQKLIEIFESGRRTMDMISEQSRAMSALFNSK